MNEHALLTLGTIWITAMAETSYDLLGCPFRTRAIFVVMIWSTTGGLLTLQSQAGHVD